MGLRPAGRLMLAIIVLSLVVFVPGSHGQAIAAADTLQVSPVADAWVNKAKAGANYGSATLLRARQGASESYLRFRLTAWLGLPINSLQLELSGLSGDASRLVVHRTGTSWKESGITWKSRPSASTAAGTPKLNGGTVRFDLKALFPNGVVAGEYVSLRVRESSGAQVSFGSRESKAKPRLVLGVGPRLAAVGLLPLADTFAHKGKPSRNFGSSALLRVSSAPAREAYLKFDLSAWNGHPIERLELQLTLADSAGKGVKFLRVGTSWKESSLTWKTRPSAGTLLATSGKQAPAGLFKVDLTPAFKGGVINSGRLALRITTGSADGFAFSSRESATPPSLRVVPASAVDSPPASPSPSPTPSPTASPTATPKPSATPTASPSPSPTPSPTASPTTTPTAQPTATPTASPSPSPSPTPTPTPTPTPEFYFRGHGNAHGVGLSQYGARYRAAEGQTHAEILAHYYAGTTLGAQDPAQTVRVLLATGHTPTSEVPARVVARNGGWTSATFPELVFPVDSYVDMVPGVEGTWTANVHDLGGALLASAQTYDLLMEPAEAGTLFYMKFRDSLRKYDLYRGQMRLRASANGVQAINVVLMNDYLKGVVPAEIVPSWPTEAVRAQAIVARSYVSFKLKSTGVWDVKPDRSHQVYGGVNIEHNATTRAVNDTLGVIVVDANGKVAETVFHAVAGGHTENNEYAFVGSTGKPGAPVSYLRGRPDVDANGVPYEIGVSAYAWSTGTFTMTQLQGILSKDSRTAVGILNSITFDRGVSGRAYRVTLTGSSGTKTISGGIFTNVYNEHKLSGGNLRSTLFYLEPAP